MYTPNDLEKKIEIPGEFWEIISILPKIIYYTFYLPVYWMYMIFYEKHEDSDTTVPSFTTSSSVQTRPVLSKNTSGRTVGQKLRDLDFMKKVGEFSRKIDFKSNGKLKTILINVW